MRLRFLFLMAISAAGCADTGSQQRRVVDVGDVPVPSHETFAPIELTSQPFSSDTALGQPGLLIARSGALWVIDYAGAPWLHSFDPVTAALVWSGGLKGEGPGQFGMVNSLGGSTTDGKLWGFDSNARRFTVIDTTLTTTTTPEIIRVSLEGRLSRAIPLGNDTFFGLLMLPPDSAHAIILDQSGQIVHQEEWPLLGADSVPRYQRLLASGASLSAVLCARPDGTKIGLVYSAAGKIDFFDNRAQHVGEADVPFPTDAAFTRGQDGELHAARPRFWYRDCTATNQYLFALFSGRREKDYEPPEGSAGEHVHVFDWDGRLVKVFHLDRGVANIGISEDGKTLYAVRIGEASIVRYELP